MGKRRRAKPDKFRVGDYTLETHRGVYVARWFDEGSQQYKKLTLGARGQKLTEDQAKIALQQFADSRHALVKLTADFTCGQLWEQWTAERAKDGFSNETYNHQWKALRPHFENRRPNELKPDDFRAYAQARFNIGRKPQTVHTELSRLRYCLKWARKAKLLKDDVDVWRPSRGKGRQLRITAEQARDLLAQAGDPHVKLFILLALTTGARHRAILELTWDRVDWINGTVDYDTREDPNPMHRNYKKGRARAPIGPVVRRELMLAYDGRQTDYVIEHGGRPLKSVRAGFANAVWRAGLDENVTPHILRHSLATWMREAGADWHKISTLLGQSDSKTPELFYTHVDPTTYVGGHVLQIEADVAALPANGKAERKKGTRRGAKRALSGTVYHPPKSGE